jgi:hypothetical protein
MTTGKAQRESRQGKKPARLAAELERLVASYSMAAAAAGVGLAAMAVSAEAEIVYTPTNTPINGRVVLDLNNDGLGDFLLINRTGSAGEGQAFAGLSVKCAQQNGTSGPCNYRTNQVWGRGVLSGRFAYALPAGFEVRSNKTFFQQLRYSSSYFGASMGFLIYGTYGAGTATFGQWLGAKDRYLGLQFVIDGQVHYGWARLSVTPTENERAEITAVLTGYAYETIPNKPIVTGKTKGPDVTTLPPAKLESATLGQLARGASQIPPWRRLNAQTKANGNLR